jgi:nicotinamidase-related amidase
MFTTRMPILLDINTQHDLFDADGKYRLAGAADIIEPLSKLFEAAKRIHTPIVSTRLHDLMQVDPPPPEPICVPGTRGYQKLPFTLCDDYEEMPMDCGTDFPVDGFLRSQQHIFDLPDANPFDSPRLDRLLSETQTPLWVIVGGPLESVVRIVILGLIQRRQPLAVVRDCCGLRDAMDFDLVMRKLESKNVEWIDASQAVERLAAQPNRGRLKHSTSVFTESLRRSKRKFKSARKSASYRP